MKLGHLKYAPNIPVHVIEQGTTESVLVHHLSMPFRYGTNVYLDSYLFNTHNNVYSLSDDPADDIWRDHYDTVSSGMGKTNLRKSSLSVCVEFPHLRVDYAPVIDKLIMSNPESRLLRVVRRHGAKEWKDVLKLVNRKFGTVSMIEGLKSDLEPLFRLMLDREDRVKLHTLLNLTEASPTVVTNTAVALELLPLNDIDFTSCEDEFLREILTSQYAMYKPREDGRLGSLELSLPRLTEPEIKMPANKITLESAVKSITTHLAVPNPLVVGSLRHKYSTTESAKHIRELCDTLRAKNMITAIRNSIDSGNGCDYLGISCTSNTRSSTTAVDTLTVDLEPIESMLDEIEQLVIPDMITRLTEKREELQKLLDEDTILEPRFNSPSRGIRGYDGVTTYTMRSVDIPYRNDNVIDTVLGHIDFSATAIRTLRNTFKGNIQKVVEYQKVLTENPDENLFEAGILVLDSLNICLTGLRRSLLYSLHKELINALTIAESYSGKIATIYESYQYTRKLMTDDQLAHRGKVMEEIREISGAVAGYKDLIGLYCSLFAYYSIVINMSLKYLFRAINCISLRDNPEHCSIAVRDLMSSYIDTD